MGESSTVNGSSNGSSPTHADVAVEDHVRSQFKHGGRSQGRTGAATASTVSLVIPVRNEARNVAWVLEQINDDVDEIILVDGASTDATLITALVTAPTSGWCRRKASARAAR